MKKLITFITLLCFLGFAYGQKMEVGSGAYVTLGQGAYMTVNGGLVTNGSFTVESNASGTGSLIITAGGSTTTSGAVSVQRFLEADKWHYISGQTNITGNFSTLNMGLGTPGSSSNAFYRWEEDYSYGGNTGIWVDILNGEDGTGTNTLMDDEGFVSCKGYSISYATNDKTLVLDGVPYVADQSVILNLTSGSTGEGANQVGNPFCSNIAINSGADGTNNFISQNTGVLDASHQAVYFWDESDTWNGTSSADYVTINNSSPAIYAEPGQAFMVVAKTDGASLAFNTNIRKHGPAIFYKNGNVPTPRLKLYVSDNAQLVNYTELVFMPGMTPGLDPSYDAAKFKGNPNLALYTKLVEDNGEDFAIQSLPVENMEDFVVAVGVDVASADWFEFTAVHENLDNQNILLEDRLLNIFTNLRWNSYFAEINQSGTGRFYLHFKDATAVDEPDDQQEVVLSYLNGKLMIRNPLHLRGMVFLANTIGQVLQKYELQGEGSMEIALCQPTGIYIVSVQTNTAKTSRKIFVR